MIGRFAAYTGGLALTLALGFGLGTSWEGARAPAPAPAPAASAAPQNLFIDPGVVEVPRLAFGPSTLEGVRRDWDLEGKLDCRTVIEP